MTDHLAAPAHIAPPDNGTVVVNNEPTPTIGDIIDNNDGETFSPVQCDGSQKSTRVGVGDATSDRAKQNGLGMNGRVALYPSMYGVPIAAETTGHFPAVGSTLGPYFCLGQLGKGTFSSIHKCIDMRYLEEKKVQNGHDETDTQPDNNKRYRRLAAAKVELSTFSQSGVLESESTILEFLHRVSPGSVPTYLGHFRSKCTVEAGASQQPAVASALVMEYLGDDMHHLREQVMQTVTPSGSTRSTTAPTRRILTKDAVYLTAHVMLPLLQHMHDVGIVHRDVKPSNCVQKLISSSDSKMNGINDDDTEAYKKFCMVDFGLSKSILVPRDSPFADQDHPWTGDTWMQPPNYSAAAEACFRKEREKAEFRGTSMYASVRVHQLHDYCPRDDLYSLLYVFCDLVSGGLPWMSYAASRDRAKCHELKEIVHGEKTAEGDDPQQADRTEWLLMGDEYHVAKYRKERQDQKEQEALPEGSVAVNRVQLPEPLAMSNDVRRVDLLRKAFQHLGTLKFWDRPDYELVRNCILGFLEFCEDDDRESGISPIQYLHKTKNSSKKSSAGRNSRNSISSLLGAGKFMPKWSYNGDVDNGDEDLDETIFHDIDESAEANTEAKLQEEKLSRLPLELRFRILQLGFNKCRPDAVPKHRALDDWMKVVLPLLYGEWDTRTFEDDGGRRSVRTSTDGFQRPLYLEVLQRCKEYAETFEKFRSRDCYFRLDEPRIDENSSQDGGTSNKRRRKLVADNDSFICVSQALFGLEHAYRVEMNKRAAPTGHFLFG